MRKSNWAVRETHFVLVRGSTRPGAMADDVCRYVRQGGVDQERGQGVVAQNDDQPACGNRLHGGGKAQRAW